MLGFCLARSRNRFRHCFSLGNREKDLLDLADAELLPPLLGLEVAGVPEGEA